MKCVLLANANAAQAVQGCPACQDVHMLRTDAGSRSRFRDGAAARYIRVNSSVNAVSLYILTVQAYLQSLRHIVSLSRLEHSAQEYLTSVSHIMPFL
jgi:hypothetical protein